MSGAASPINDRPNNRLPAAREQPSWLVRVSIAVGLVVAALLLQLLFRDFFIRFPFFLFFPAVILAAWYGGILAGLVATVLSVVVVNYFFLPSFNAFSLAPNNMLASTLFTGITLFMAALRQRERRTQRLFDQQREELRVTLESIGDGVITTDTTGRVTFLNPVAAQLTGWLLEEAVGHDIGHVFRIVNETTREPVISPIKKALEQGVVVGLANHTVLLSKTGREIPISDSGSPIYDREGTLLGAVMVFRDITERREAELALEASEKRYRTLVENATDIIYTLAPDGKLTSINAAGEQLLGYPRAALLHQPIAPYIAPEYLSLSLDMLERKMRGEEQTVYEIELLARDGSRPMVEVNSQLIKVEGQVIGTYGIARDVTQRKQAEQRNRLLQEFAIALSGAVTLQEVTMVTMQTVAQTAKSTMSAVFRLSDDGKQLERLGSLGLSTTYLEQSPNFPMDGNFPIVDAVRHRQVIWFETQEAYIRRYPHLEPEIVAVNIQMVLCVPFFGRNTVSGGMHITYTEPKTLSLEERNFLFSIAQTCGQALERAALFEAEAKARQQAEAADQLKVQFLGMISHELRTPLTSLKGFASTLAADDVEYPREQQRQFARIMDEEADKLTSLVEELLDLSSLAAGRLEIVPIPQSLSDVITTARAELNSLARQHPLHLDVSPALPLVLVDNQRIAQVLTNLVGNAVKYSPEGSSIRVSAWQNEHDVHVEVDDEGMGIPEAAREIVFEAFQQVDRQKRGAGLGLAICKGIVEAHGGRIWIADKQTPGTRVVFTLPISVQRD
jgi:PAS domain S-box-containing protein